ncbi:hypothetical protein [Sphingosinicella sp. CPCC 101087]|uniref:hypothetical protein n=1 Tax=Sphingosinicella sp. CPCC 101087 TaxID=2497754 RepID=UPI00101D7D94|nr:hypothetical protein [Sphingosinicella sp. CPCC 101087]
MPQAWDVWAEAIGAMIVIVFLPFYIGFLHLSVVELLLYAALAGVGLTAGDYLQFPPVRPLGLAELAMDSALWTQAVLGAGLIAYLLALALV